MLFKDITSNLPQVYNVQQQETKKLGQKKDHKQSGHQLRCDITMSHLDVS